jgi:hypothetical protein
MYALALAVKAGCEVSFLDDAQNYLRTVHNDCVEKGYSGKVINGIVGYIARVMYELGHDSRERGALVLQQIREDTGPIDWAALGWILPCIADWGSKETKNLWSWITSNIQYEKNGAHLLRSYVASYAPNRRISTY